MLLLWELIYSQQFCYQTICTFLDILYCPLFFLSNLFIDLQSILIANISLSVFTFSIAFFFKRLIAQRTIISRNSQITNLMGIVLTILVGLFLISIGNHINPALGYIIAFWEYMFYRPHEHLLICSLPKISP